MGAVEEFTASYRARIGVEIEARFAPTAALLDPIREGAQVGGPPRGDAAILTANGVGELIAAGTMMAGSRSDIALSHVGFAVRTGAPKPDITSVETLRTALLNARTVAYSKIGASGIKFSLLLDRLGLATEVKTPVVPSGFTAEGLISAEADFAVQQISELRLVPGIETVGPLPAEIETAVMFVGAIFGDSPDIEAARAFLHSLSAPDAVPILTASGLQPAA
jgi:molybdate transport system substrate-binding protein